MNYGKCPHEAITELIDQHMEVLCNEATMIRKTITNSNGVYLGQLDRLAKLCNDVEDFALLFDQASKQAKKLAREMKEFNEKVISQVEKGLNK